MPEPSRPVEAQATTKPFVRRATAGSCCELTVVVLTRNATPSCGVTLNLPVPELAAKVDEPAKLAVTLWLRVERRDRLIAAFPPEIAALPKVFDPSLKTTLPDGVPEAGAATAIVAVSFSV